MTATTTSHAADGCVCGCADELALIRAELAALRAEVARLTPGPREAPAREQPFQAASAGARERLVTERVALFRSLFVGRDDVYAQRWEKDGRKGWYPQLERLPGQTSQEAKDARRYRPLTDAVLHDHLAGKISAWPCRAGRREERRGAETRRGGGDGSRPPERSAIRQTGRPAPAAANTVTATTRTGQPTGETVRNVGDHGQNRPGRRRPNHPAGPPTQPKEPS